MILSGHRVVFAITLLSILNNQMQTSNSGLSSIHDTHFVCFVIQVPIEWESVDVTPVRGPDGRFGIPQAAIDSVNKNKVGLKGPLMTPVGKGHRSLNLALRK